MISEEEAAQGLRAAARELAKSIAGSECYREFERAQDAFQADPEARRIFEEFLATERNARLAESWGGLTEEERRWVEELRMTMSSNETLKRRFDAQERFIAVLKEVNELMAAQLGFDLAAMARPATGCCG